MRVCALRHSLIALLVSLTSASAGDLSFGTPEFEPIWSGGDMDAPKLDILILSEGYTQPQMTKFETDARRVAKEIRDTEPFASYGDFYRVWLVRCISKESGSRKEKDPAKDTCFDSYYGSALCPGADLTNVQLAREYVYRKRERSVGDNIVLILVNSDEYGGSAQDGNRLCISSIPVFPLTTIQHEIGHILGHLADEYFTKGVERPPTETPAPNCPNLVPAADDPKWKAWDKEPVSWKSTDGKGETKTGTVGFFPGGWGKELGLWRPTDEACMMKRVEHPTYCPVCREGIIRGLYEHVKIIMASGTEEMPGEPGFYAWVDVAIPEKSAKVVWLIGADPFVVRDAKWMTKLMTGDIEKRRYMVKIEPSEASQPILAVVYDDPPEIRMEFNDIRYFYELVDVIPPAFSPK